MKKSKQDTFNVFLVEDDEIYRDLIVPQLEKHLPVNVRKYSMGSYCLKDINQHDPKAIILDYHLDFYNPDAMSGLDILKKIHDIHPDLPVIMISREDNEALSEKAKSLGAEAFVTKSKSAIQKIIHLLSDLTKSSVK